MKKIARVLLNRDMLMLYIVNFLLADTAIFVFFLVMVAAFLEKYNYLILAVIIMVGRLFILPKPNGQNIKYAITSTINFK